MATSSTKATTTVRTMFTAATARILAPRRAAVALTTALVLGVAAGAPAAAHPSFTPSLAKRGQPVHLTLLVDSHFATPLVNVGISIPQGFTLSKATPAVGWTPGATSFGDQADVRFEGSLAPGKVGVFGIDGTPTAARALVFVIETRSQAGEVFRWDGGCGSRTAPPGALLFVDVDPDDVCAKAPSADDGEGGVPTGLLGGVFVVAGVGLVAFLVYRRRRW